MLNELDILYYDNVMESVIEDRKIMESLTGVKIANIALTESKDELTIYEAKVVDTVIEFIKNLFEKVVNFVKNLWESITRQKIFKPKQKLIEAVEEKMKSISSEDRNKFQLKDALYDKYIEQNIKECDEMYSKSNSFLNIAIVKTNEYLKYDKNSIGKESPISDSEFEKIKNGMVKLNDDLAKIENKEEIKKNGMNVNYDDISSILNDYKRAENVTKDLNNKYKEITNSMKKNQKNMNSHVLYNKLAVIHPYKSDEINNYRQLIYSITSFIIKLKKVEVDMHILNYRNKESILRAFVYYNGKDIPTVYTGNSNSSPSVPLLNSYIDDEYDDMVNEIFKERE